MAPSKTSTQIILLHRDLIASTWSSRAQPRRGQELQEGGLRAVVEHVSHAGARQSDVSIDQHFGLPLPIRAAVLQCAIGSNRPTQCVVGFQGWRVQGIPGLAG